MCHTACMVSRHKTVQECRGFRYGKQGYFRKIRKTGHFVLPERKRTFCAPAESPDKSSGRKQEINRKNSLLLRFKCTCWRGSKSVCGNFNTAERLFTEITEREPYNPWGWYLLGELFNETERYGKSFICFKEALNIVPNHKPSASALLETKKKGA